MGKNKYKKEKFQRIQGALLAASLALTSVIFPAALPFAGNITAYADTVVPSFQQSDKTVDSATQAVITAEQQKTLSSVESARTIVNQLSSGDNKDSLNYRLDLVQFKCYQQGVNDSASFSGITSYLNSIRVEDSFVYSETAKFTFVRNGVTANAWRVRLKPSACTDYGYGYIWVVKVNGQWSLVVGQNNSGKLYFVDECNKVAYSPNGIIAGSSYNQFDSMGDGGYLQVYDVFTNARKTGPYIATYYKWILCSEYRICVNNVYSAKDTVTFYYHDSADSNNLAVQGYLTVKLGTLETVTSGLAPYYQKNYAYINDHTVVYTDGSRIYVYDTNTSTQIRNYPGTFNSVVFDSYPGYAVLDTYSHNNINVLDLDTYQLNSSLAQDFILINYTYKVVNNAVAYAESSKSQSALDSARTQVNALADCDYKTSLNGRLDAVKAIIDAQNVQLQIAKTAVANVKQTLTSEDLAIAQAEVAKIPIDNNDKTSLADDLKYTVTSYVNDANYARIRMDYLEANPNYNNYSNAYYAIGPLPTSQAKTDLQNRLSAVGINLAITSDKQPPYNPTAQSVIVEADGEIKTKITITPGTDFSYTLLPPSGIDKTQYRINGGNWIDYTEPFYLDVFGNVKIEYRSIDKAGNISYIVTGWINSTNYNAQVTAIKSNLKVIKNSPATSLFLFFQTKTQINVLPSCTTRTDLQSQLDGLSPSVAIATDKAAPTAPTMNLNMDKGLVTVANGTDSAPSNTLASGVAKSQYCINDGIWTDYSAPFNLGGAYDNVTIKARTIDKAGNISAVTSKTYSVPQDKTAPDAPTIEIGSDEKTITLVPGEDKSLLDISNPIDITENFEDTVADFSNYGSWFRTTENHADGNYCLRSGFIGNRGSSSQTFAVDVPSGSNANLSFKYRVSSETGCDFLTVYVDGVMQTRISGLQGWMDFSKALTSGHHTVQFVYSKDYSIARNSDAAYVDVINIKSNGTIIPPSGVSKMQYMIDDDGNWKDYNGAFVPDKGGAITIYTREIDNAGNISAVNSKAVTIKNDMLQQVQQQMTEVETLTNDLSTQTKIDEAITQLNAVENSMDQISAGSEKDALQTRINAVKNTLTIAQNILNAKNAVTKVEENTADLSTQAKVDTAYSNYDAAVKAMDSIPDGAVKTDLNNRLSIAKVSIDNAQGTLKVQGVEALLNNLSSQDLIDGARSAYSNAINFVNGLQESGVKDNLLTRLDAAKYTIDVAQSDVYIKLAETASQDMTSMDKCDAAQEKLNTALDFENNLRSGDVKDAFLNRIAIVQEKIYEARAEIKVSEAEKATVDLSTWDKCNDAQAIHDAALPYINKLPENLYERQTLQARINGIQVAIDTARATIKVTTAENSISQADVTATQPYIDKLPSGDVKNDLQHRLYTVQAVINATNQITDTQTGLSDMETILSSYDLSVSSKAQREILINELQISIDKVTAACNKAVDLINAVPTTDKQTLFDRLANLEEQVVIINGYEGSMEQILTEAQDNANKSNGGTEIRNNIGRNAAINVVDAYGDQIKSAIGLDGLKFMAIDQGSLTVDAAGNVTTIKNGVAKMTVYNDKGMVDIYFVISGNGK